MKRVCILVFALLLMAVSFGCATPSAPNPTVIPEVTPIITPSASPITTMPQETPDDTGGAITPGTDASTTIPNFKEGTEVNVSDLPDIKSALQEKYEGATISKITHSLQSDRQLYRIDYTDQGGKEAFLYMMPDGQIVTIDAANPAETTTP